jgi:hypothetical protein
MISRARIVRAAIVVPLAATPFLGWACSQNEHLFRGRQYDPTLDCIGADTVLDVVEGEPPNTDCPATCFVVSAADGGFTRYVSTMCGERPPGALVGTAEDGICTTALAAFARNSRCLLDGGASNALPDAAAEAAATDAADGAP